MTPQRRHLLVISYHSPPSPAVGGLRWWGLSKYLNRMGWAVTVLTRGSTDNAEASPPGSVRVRRVSKRRTVEERYRAWKTRSKGWKVPVSGGASPESTGRGPPGLVRAEISAWLGFPDEARGWLLPALKRGMDLIREDPPDMIVSTGPPHSTHVVASLLGASGIPTVMDYRDPWQGQAPSPGTAAVLHRVEAYLGRRADAILATTPELTERLAGRFPGTVVRWLPNGVDVEGLPRWRQPQGPGITVVHVGTLYLGRDPAPVIRGFAAFLRLHPAAAAHSELRLVGHTESSQQRTIERLTVELGLRDQVRCSPPVPRDEALGILTNCHLAIVLAQDQPGMVPAKLYESVGMGVPTLVVTEADSASAKAARRVGAQCREHSDVTGIARVMREAWTAGATHAERVPERLSYLELAEDAHRILKAI